jgi:hypothetical protein
MDGERSTRSPLGSPFRNSQSVIAAELAAAGFSQGIRVALAVDGAKNLCGSRGAGPLRQPVVDPRLDSDAQVDVQVQQITLGRLAAVVGKSSSADHNGQHSISGAKPCP